MSDRRSKSPRRKREISFSSLSSDSFDNIRGSSYSQKPKASRDRKRDGRRHDRASSRRYSPERSGSKMPRYDDEHSKSSQKERSRKHYDSPEESYLPMPSLQKGHNHLTINETHQGGRDLEESMCDPSTCNFRGDSHEIIQVSENEDMDQMSTTKPHDRRNIKEETNNRIDRLERLVELLAQTTNPSNSLKNQQKAQENIKNTDINPFELIPRNSNFTTSMWLNKIQEECVERNLDEKTTLKFVQSKMTGVIKAWFKTVSSYDFTWPELKMLITETFPDNIDFALTLKLLVERNKKPDETITQYYFSKMYLLEACKISGENAVSCLIDGLSNEVWKQEAKVQKFLTPESLYFQFLSKCTDYDEEEEYSQEHQQVQVATPQEVEVPYHDNMERKRDNRFFRNDRNHFKNKKCFTCHKLGHITVDCRHAPICYRCQNKGHIAINCPMQM